LFLKKAVINILQQGAQREGDKSDIPSSFDLSLFKQNSEIATFTCRMLAAKKVV